mgnify:CR=1 FL=1
MFERIYLDVNSKSEGWISYLNNLFFNLNFEDQASVFQVKIIYLQDVISIVFSCHALFLDEKMLEKIAMKHLKKYKIRMFQACLGYG